MGIPRISYYKILIMEDMTMKKIEIDTFLKFRFLSNPPHFSPNGTKIAFTVSVPDRGGQWLSV